MAPRSRTPAGLLALVLLAVAAAPALGAAAGPSDGASWLNVVLGVGGLVAAGLIVYWNARPMSSAPRPVGPAALLDPDQAARADAGTATARAARAKRVATAAEIAAASDPWLAPGTVEADAARLLRDVLAAWDADDRAGLEGLLAPALSAGWARALDAQSRRGRHRRVVLRGPAAIEYLGLVNDVGEAGDRVVVRISAAAEEWAEDAVGGAGPRRAGALRRYWTLCRREGRWILVADRDDTAGSQVLQARIVGAAGPVPVRP